MSELTHPHQTYLAAALAWLDARLERDIRRWQLAGQDPSDRFRGLYLSGAAALDLARRGAGGQWGTGVDLPEDEEKRLSAAQEAARQAMRDLEAAPVPRLKALQSRFRLTDFEWWAFIICLAPAVDLRYERVYGFLQDDVTRTCASVDLILSLLLPEAGLSRLEALPVFEPRAALRTFRLLLPVEENGKPASLLRQTFRVEAGVVNWLLGEDAPSASLGDAVELFPAPPQAIQAFSHPQMPAADTLARVKPLLSLHGPDALQQELAAQEAAAALRRPLLSLKISSEVEREEAVQQLYTAVRDASLLQALLFVRGCDAFIDADGCLLPRAFHAIDLLDGPVITGSLRPYRFHPEMPGSDSPLMSVALDRLSAAERADLWAALLEGVDEVIPRKEMLILAGQFNLTSGQVTAAASTAMSRALQEGRALQAADLFEAARVHSGHHLGDLARKIEPRYVWEDLVLPETPITMLKEMVNMVQSRPLVLENWGLGRKLAAGKGVSALFSGPPGTGKTLAAQIMANQLGIDLYRIDLSTVVSKYVGETEKNLESIFSEAAESNAILFFDEADSIFGKRSEVKDAHDRYANIEVGYLLQRMEDYSGVAILATNLRSNLDEAFTRRLQFIINFPFPDEAYRLNIWKVLMPPDLPRAEDLDLALMARRFKLAGGSIRNIIVSAAYLAAVDGGTVTMSHLMHGARREFQKMGRLVQESDFVLP